MKKNSRRDFLAKAIAMGSVAAFPFKGFSFQSQTVETIALPSLKGKKILFTYGGWNGHEPKKFRDYMVPWLREEGAEVLA
ncbi:MAG: twin-arginine translocation signal domain-containing protein, partial [Chitinophagaceae bacterium]